ncbi:response regulator [Gaetbulibacter sp. M235]|uniref:hybrid sensor histidine kinase/response regulator transcription factor n=1 Tax=Gaetbulibacter sp. M235 TaxID=3126510 RepID=UPI00374F9E22
MKHLLPHILSIFFLSSFFVFSQNAHFINLTREDGLASNFVRVIDQDSYGYMWFGTDNGLNRYDGINMDLYRNNRQDASSLSNNHIVDILHTSIGKLIVCTTNSVDVFNYKTEKFEHLNFIDNHIFKGIIETFENEIWVLTRNNVVNILNADLQFINSLDLLRLRKNRPSFKKNVNVFKYNKNNLVLYYEGDGFYLLNSKTKKLNFLCNDIIPNSIHIIKIYPISKSEFWIMSLSGVFVVKNGVITNKYVEGDIKTSKNLTSNFVLDLKIMPNNEYWLFTDGGGINIFNSITKKFRYIVNDLNNNYSLASNFIYTTYIDNNSSLWLGTVKNGVSQFDNENPFSTYKVIKTENNQKFDVPVISLFLDSKNRIWVGCDGKGLYKFENNILEQVLYDESIKTISSINQIESDILILGTYKNGLSTYNVKEHRLTQQKYINNLLNLDTKITFIEKDDNFFYIGGNKIVRFNRKNNSLFINPDINFTSNNLRALSFEKYSNNAFYIGHSTGLFKYSNDKFEVTSNLPKKVNSIYKYNENNYWLATNSGLALIDINKKKTIIYGSESGLNNENINSILAYNFNSLWLGTSQGISNFNTETKKFTNYTYKDGFIDNSFKSLKSLKLNDGRLVFGGVKGLLVFHPDSIKTKTKTNKVIFTKLFINNKNLALNGNKVLNAPLEQTKLITLNHKDKVIKINFTSFNFKYAKNIKFSYKLEGYNNEWSITKERSLTYMNLSPGTYTLKVKASSLSGLWDESYSSITLKVLPAWWQTIWFKILVISFIIFIIFIINKTILNKERLKRDFEFEKKTLKEQNELDEKQLEFFTNLSHEIRTPLSLIISPVESIIKETTNLNIKNNLSLIQKNALRINRLINRGVDFRKTQFKEPDIQIVQEDIISFLKELIGSFSDFSMSKHIELEFISNRDSLLLWFDKYMVETIFYNLLSNAFKYSNKNDKILLKINLKDEHVSIIVQDFGQGILKEDIPYIFERFYQSKNHIGGYGIGLALTQEFVKAHKGSIKVDSVFGKGSTFEVIFQLGNSHFEKSDLVELNNKTEYVLSENKLSEHNEILDVKLKNKTILVVEDETTLRDYLYTNLSKTYIVITAENGLEALDIIKNQKIHLVVSDIAMPIMNGFEFCKKLKENVKTCDVPIILLTAKTRNEEKVEGYETGADAYLEKPFSLDVLKSRINNLLQRRIRLKDKMVDNLDITIDSETINTSDEKFYEQTLAIIEKHIDDIDFNITTFSKELGMSKSLIYSKMSKITNMSINNLILTIRLNKASQMLIYTNKPIVDISLLVGFQNAKYFSTSFKKRFGTTPSKYRDEKSNLNEI